jgi:pimeloyl-ACP methyl ester carboxylesterase
VDWGGPGPAVHFAHGNGLPPGAYGRFLRTLAGRFAVTSMEARPLWPGSDPAGLADWDPLVTDLAEGLERHGLRGCLGVGHSLGAICSILASVRDPGLFRALVLVDPVLLSGYRAIAWHLALRTGQMHRVPIVRGALQRRSRWASRDEVRGLWGAKPMFAAWAPGVLDDYLECGLVPLPDGGVTLRYPKEWEARVFQTTPMWTWDVLARIPVPVLVLRGERSDTFLPGAARAFRRRLPSATLVDVPGTTHLLPMERPEEVARLAADFLDRFR